MKRGSCVSKYVQIKKQGSFQGQEKKKKTLFLFSSCDKKMNK